MKTELTAFNSYSIPDIEKELHQTKVELLDYCDLQGQQDGLKENLIGIVTYKVKLLDYIQSTIQHLIDFIKQLTLITAHVLHIQELELQAKQRCEQAQLIIDGIEHEIKALIRKQKELHIDPFKLKYGKWSLPIAVFVGACDGIGAYTSFRSASFSTLLALISSIAIALVISTTHFLYAGWVLSSTGWKRKLTIFFILILAFIFFAWIGEMRAVGINSVISIAVPGDNATQTLPHISQWAIAGISFILFATVLFLSLVLWLSKEENKCKDKYEEYCKLSFPAC